MGSERGYREFGRHRALDELAGDGGLLVAGPSGCGRSTLLTEIDAHEGGRRRVWWCRGHHVGGASGDREVVSGTVPSVLEAADETATTVLVDDVHLLDDPVVERLVSPAERRADLGLRMVATRPPGPVRPALARLESVLLGPGGALHLGPLGVAGVAAWLAEALPAGRDEPGAAELTAATGGWPELVAAALAAGLLHSSP